MHSQAQRRLTPLAETKHSGDELRSSTRLTAMPYVTNEFDAEAKGHRALSEESQHNGDELLTPWASSS